MKYRVSKRHPFPTAMPSTDWLELNKSTHPEFGSTKLGAMAFHERTLCVVIRHERTAWAVPLQNLDRSTAFHALSDSDRETALQWRADAYAGKYQRAVDDHNQRTRDLDGGMF